MWLSRGRNRSSRSTGGRRAHLRSAPCALLLAAAGPKSAGRYQALRAPVDQIATRLKQLPALLALLILALLAGSAGGLEQRFTPAAAAAHWESALPDDVAGRFPDKVQEPISSDGSDEPDLDDLALSAVHRSPAAQKPGHGYRRPAFAPVRNGRGSFYRARAPPAA